MIHNIGLIAFESFIYSLILLIRKNYILNKISNELFILFSGLVSLVMLAIYLLYNKIDIFSKSNIKGLKEIYIIMFSILIVGTLNWYLFLYLLKNNELSVLVPLNQLFVVISSCLLGYFLLNEKISNENILGIILGTISIILINK